MNSDYDPHLFSPRRLNVSDAPAGFALSMQAGWNQTEQDWKLMIEFGQGIGLVDPSERLIATSVLLPYRNRIDWVSMVLVDQAWRRQGLGSRLLRLITELSPNPILGLDATDQGAPIYDKLGFAASEGITRHALNAPTSRTASVNDMQITELSVDRFGDLLVTFIRDVDRTRQALLRRLDSSGSRMYRLSRAEKVAAIASVRPGRVASQVGPLLATDAASALGLVRWIVSQQGDEFIVDVPDRHRALTSSLASLGFTPSRTFTRMFRGGMPPPNPHEYGIAGPEFG